MTDKTNMMEEYIRGLIKDELTKQCDLLGVALKEEDASKIVLAIIPHIDELVSKRVKHHFIEIAEFIKTQFSNEEK
jgi:hypothetical protein